MLMRSSLRDIKNSFGRYMAIFAIVALGVGFFSGLKISKEAMVKTADEYLTDQKFYDYRLVSSLGFDSKSIEKIKENRDIYKVEGSKTADFIYLGKGNVERVIHSLSMPQDINKLHISHGRAPKANNECVVDNRIFTKKDLGSSIKLALTNTPDSLDKFKYKEYKIVGIAMSPIYLNFERGSTNLGNGSVSAFMYIPENGFAEKYYSDVYVTLKDHKQIFSSQYDKYIKKNKPSVNKSLKAAAALRYNEIRKEAQDTLDKEKKSYEEGVTNYNNEEAMARNGLTNGWKDIEEAETKLNQSKKDLDEQTYSLSLGEDSLNKAIDDYNAQVDQFNENMAYMSPEEIAQTQAIINATAKKLEEEKVKLKAGKEALASGREQLNQGYSSLEGAKHSYYNKKAEADKKLSDGKAELYLGKTKLDDAQKQIDEIPKPETYLLTRTSNVGYLAFENDSNVVNGIAQVFPAFFFLVAALVCMTTMTRMVDERRTEIGIFKAIGYSNVWVLSKFMFYAGSAAFMGTVVGFLGGSYIFPATIWRAYGIMYDFNRSIDYILDPTLGTLSLLVAMIGALGSTFISCEADFRVMPAELIRPKAPKEGKRILLERIGFIWKHLSFLYKVSLRNIFRYKKRLFMMILGISGCTALVLTGFGINDSIKNIAEYQFKEIMTYDYSINFKDNMEGKEEEFAKETKDHISSIIFLQETAANVISKSNNTGVKLIVTHGKDFSSFINLKNSQESLKFPSKGKAIICEKLAKAKGYKVGDTIEIENANHKLAKVEVGDICINYVNNYIYLSPETYYSAWGVAPEYKTALAHVKGVKHPFDANDKAAVDKIYSSSASVMNIDGVMGTFINNDMHRRINSMMDSLDAVIAVIILSAGLLAFIVLYNLTNINILERIREIATIKVLGFYPKETSLYVFRENIFLTIMSALVGLGLGKFLHKFVMDQIQVDLIFFQVRISWPSYIYAFLITLAFTALVNFILYFKLQRVNMIESLKAVE